MQNKEIKEFRGSNYYLSNFYSNSDDPTFEFEYDGIKWKSSEAAFQAAKTLNKEERIKVSKMSPSESKKACGRRGLLLPNGNIFKITLRPDWEEVKDEIMHDILVAKFEQNPSLKHKLLSTEDAYLEEGNTWHDNIWGNCHCGRIGCVQQGQNRLGKALMKVREELR